MVLPIGTKVAGRTSEGGRARPCTSSSSPTYFLWVWENPRPDVAVTEIELVAETEGVLVAAITTADADEHPFAREAARTVRFGASGG